MTQYDDVEKEQKMEREKSDLKKGLGRRQILGWMGLGLIGAFAINALPFKFISRRFRRQSRRSKNVNVSINGMAVKRNKPKFPKSVKAI